MDFFFTLTGTSWDLNNTAVKQEHMSGPSDDSTSSRVSHMFLFSDFIVLLVCIEEHSSTRGKTGKRGIWEATDR